MMWGYFDGWNWLWMAGMMLLFWGGLITLAILAIRAFSAMRQTRDQAQVTLRQRLAAGDISQEDFDRTNKVLQG